MNRRIAMIAFATAGIGVLAMAPRHEPAQAQQAPQPKDTQPSSRMLGSQSCAASICHGEPKIGKSSGAYTTWLSRDPHAHAYDALLNVRSEAIARNLWRDQKAAHAEPLCLKCHVDPHYDRAAVSFRLQDGVGCESCHGPAEAWRLKHYRGGGNRDGMADTKSLPGRVQRCVGCHVGTPDAEVDHDLIAAGHPALRFEFASHYANLPPHWDVAKARGDPPADFESRAWTTGQLVSAGQAMTLLAHRANGKAWPEFAEFDCFACHHDLQAASSRPARARPGSLVGNEWYTAMLPIILGEPIPQALRDRTAARSQIAREAEGFAKKLSGIERPFRPEWLEALRRGIPVNASWEGLAQHYCALTALQPMSKERPLAGLIDELRARVTFPSGFDSPHRPTESRTR